MHYDKNHCRRTEKKCRRMHTHFNNFFFMFFFFFVQWIDDILTLESTTTRLNHFFCCSAKISEETVQFKYASIFFSLSLSLVVLVFMLGCHAIRSNNNRQHFIYIYTKKTIIIYLLESGLFQCFFFRIVCLFSFRCLFVVFHLLLLLCRERERTTTTKSNVFIFGSSFVIRFAILLSMLYMSP